MYKGDVTAGFMQTAPFQSQLAWLIRCSLQGSQVGLGTSISISTSIPLGRYRLMYLTPSHLIVGAWLGVALPSLLFLSL